MDGYGSPGDRTLRSLTHIEQARELIGAIQRLSLARSVGEIQRIVRSSARRLTGADGATFILRENDVCYYADEDAISPLWKGRRFRMQECVSGWAMLNSEAAIVPDIYADDRVPQEAYRPTFVKSLAMVPIRKLDPLGAIGNYWADRHEPTDEEVDLLQALADATAVAMENVRMVKELDDARVETLRRLALAAEYRDDDTFEHTERVARTVRAVAEQLGLPRAEITLIGQAAPLHDIGKLAISDAILLKKGPLTTHEMNEVRAHAAAGAAILADSNSDVLRLAQEIALTHHEWWNGNGYPRGLKARSIPLSGRITAVADVFDALTHERPYKRAWPVDRAMEEITGLSARQFDPEIVDAFINLDQVELAGPVDAGLHIHESSVH